MPKLSNILPKYRRHYNRDRAFVCLNGRRIYLPGPYKSPESKKEYQRLLLEWVTTDRVEPPPPGTVLVAELIDRFWSHAQKHFVRNGMPTGSAETYKPALRALKKYYGHTAAVEFGPLALKALQRKMIESGNSRRYINDNVHKIRKVFRWGASEQLFSQSVWAELTTVDGLRKGRTSARETDPVEPVDDLIVEQTLKHVSAVVVAMVRLQRLTGMRPGEVCMLRPCDLDRRCPVWIYAPAEHKTEHHGKNRLIFIGERAQAILSPYLTRDPKSYCFSPRESECGRRLKLHSERKTPLSCGNRPGSNRKKRPDRFSGVCYTKDSYRRAVTRGCEIAFNMPKELRSIKKKDPNRTTLLAQAAKWRTENCWSPNQLRHATATEVREHFGLEAAQIILGHSHVNTAEIYAKKNMALGQQVAQAIG